MENIKATIKNFNLNIVQIFSNKFNLILIISFTILGVIAPVVFFPFKACVGISLLICIVPTTACIYYQVTLQVNKSTLRKNINMGNMTKINYYFSSIFSIFVITTILLLILYFSFTLLFALNLLKSNWFEYDNDWIEILNWPWFLIYIYCGYLISAITFSISFAFQSIFKSSSAYFSFIMSLVILGVIFGGALNGYFHIFTDADGSLKFGILQGKRYGLFPNETWCVSIIFPLYSPATLITSTTDLLSTSRFHSGIMNFVDVFQIFNPRNITIELLITEIIPFFYIALFFTIGFLFSKRKNQ